MNDLLALLARMTRVEHVTLRFPPDEALTFSALHAAVESTPIALPTAHALDIDSAMHALIPVCPNVRTLRLNATSRWASRQSDTDKAGLRVCAAASQLRRFELLGRWDVSTLALVYDAMPQLTHLAIPSLHSNTLRDLVPALSSFTRMQTLVLPGAADLGLGFHPPRNGKLYKGCKGPALRQRVNELRACANRKAASICFAAYTALETVRVGERTRAMVRTGPMGGEGGWKSWRGQRWRNGVSKVRIACSVWASFSPSLNGFNGLQCFRANVRRAVVQRCVVVDSKSHRGAFMHLLPAKLPDLFHTAPNHRAAGQSRAATSFIDSLMRWNS